MGSITLTRFRSRDMVRYDCLEMSLPGHYHLRCGEVWKNSTRKFGRSCSIALAMQLLLLYPEKTKYLADLVRGTDEPCDRSSIPHTAVKYRSEKTCGFLAAI